MTAYGSKSDYLEAKLLDFYLGCVPFTPPATIWIAASTALYDDAATGSACNEVSSTSTGYLRLELTNDLTTWTGASGSAPTATANAIDFIFATATGDWGLVKSLYVIDASAAGNVLTGGNLASAVPVNSGGVLHVPAGNWSIEED